MLRLSLIAIALIASAAASARPMIIHQSQTLQPPAGYYFFGYEVAIDGDWAIVMAATRSATPANPQETHDALLYHRVNGQWTLDRTLVRRVSTTYPPRELVYFRSVAMNNGVAAIGSNPTHIFKRTNNTWAEIAHPFTAPQGDPDWVSGELMWDGNALLATKPPCCYNPQPPWGALISRLNVDGGWSALERLSSGDTNCTHDPVRWGFSGDTVVTATWPNDIQTATDQLHIFRRSGITWMPTVAIGGGNGMGDVRGNEIFIPSRLHTGTAVYRNDDSLTVVDVLRTVSASYGESWSSYAFMHSNDVFVQAGDVFRKNVAGNYEHVAILKPRGNYGLTGDAKINGQRLISPVYRDYSSSNPAAVIFDLPTTYTPSRVIATGFENGRPPPFSPQLGSFAVATKTNGNHVYRQSSPTGEYRALLNNSDWEEQSIEADIKPTAFGSSYGWAGLAVRHLDDANYYAVALGYPGVVELRFVRNGVSTTMMQKPLPIVAGRSYHVSLQAYGTMITVRIDGKEFLWSTEAQRIPKGSAALLGNETTADYDNVVVAEVGQRPIFGLFYSNCYGPLTSARSPEWTINGTGNWSCASETGQNIMQQTSIAGDARAMVGTPTDDQIVTTRARATVFGAGQDRWFGIAARYVDASNYYFLSVRNSNTLSLRKVVNGAVTVLGTVSFTVRPNTWYDLRLDAVGNELRGFINGAQVLTATDASHASGQGGIVTYRTAAEYANYLAWQP